MLLVEEQLMLDLHYLMIKEDGLFILVGMQLLYLGQGEDLLLWLKKIQIKGNNDKAPI